MTNEKGSTPPSFAAVNAALEKSFAARREAYHIYWDADKVRNGRKLAGDRVAASRKAVEAANGVCKFAHAELLAACAARRAAMLADKLAANRVSRAYKAVDDGDAAYKLAHAKHTAAEDDHYAWLAAKNR